MKQFLALALLLVCAVTVDAATPTLTNFNKLYFRVDTSGPATNVIKPRLNPDQFDDSGNSPKGFTITNISGLTGSTHWTNENVGGPIFRLRPRLDLTFAYIIVSNIVDEGFFGGTPDVEILSLGMNDIRSDLFSSVLLFSPTNDAAQVTLRLYPGAFTGQELILMSLTNAPSGGLFTLEANSALFGGGGVAKLNNDVDWLGSDGSVLQMVYIDPDWWETGRWFAGTNATFTNVFNNVTITNLTVISNITLRGNSSIILTNNTFITINGTNVGVMNPTIGKIPVKAATNAFADSSWWQAEADIVANPDLTRFGLTNDLPHFSTDPVVGVYNDGTANDRAALIMDAVQTGTRTPFYLYSITTNGSSVATHLLETSSAGSLGATAIGQQITHAASSTNSGGNSGVLNVAGTIGLYSTVTATEATQGTIGALGTTDGRGLWNVGVGARVTQLSTGRTNAVFHGLLRNQGDSDNSTVALLEAYDLSDVADGNNSRVDQNAILTLEARTTGYPLLVGRENSGTVNAVIESDGIVSTRKAFQQYQNSLTHAGDVDLDFDAAVTDSSLTLTGNVTFTFSNLATNRNYQVRVINSQATNCTLTLPVGTRGFYATLIEPSTWLLLSAKAFGTAATDVYVATSSEGTYDPSSTEIWINNSGVIEPLGGQDTNVLRFTSGLADNPTNVAAVVDTVSDWTPSTAVLLRAKNAGTNMLEIQNRGEIIIGPNTRARLGSSTTTLQSFRDTAAGDPDAWGIALGSGDPTGTGVLKAIDILGDSTSLKIIGYKDDFDQVFRLHPTIAAGSTPYRLDTTLSHTSGNLFEVPNNTTNKFTVTYDGTITAAGSANIAATLSAGSGVFTNNVSAKGEAGNTNVIDLALTAKHFVTNVVTGALTYAHATNGPTDGSLLTKIVKLMVPSGGPHTFTIPSGWRTNVFSAVPPALTNGTITWMYLKCDGPTSDAASQTNCYVSFEYYQ